MQACSSKSPRSGVLSEFRKRTETGPRSEHTWAPSGEGQTGLAVLAHPGHVQEQEPGDPGGRAGDTRATLGSKRRGAEGLASQGQGLPTGQVAASVCTHLRAGPHSACAKWSMHIRASSGLGCLWPRQGPPSGGGVCPKHTHTNRASQGWAAPTLVGGQVPLADPPSVLTLEVTLPSLLKAGGQPGTGLALPRTEGLTQVPRGDGVDLPPRCVLPCGQLVADSARVRDDLAQPQLQVHLALKGTGTECHRGEAAAESSLAPWEALPARAPDRTQALGRGFSGTASASPLGAHAVSEVRGQRCWSRCFAKQLQMRCVSTHAA